MKKWVVTDRQGREIYLTQERWEHILSKHFELDGRLDDVFYTIRFGKRKQTKRDPQTFFYYQHFDDLPEPYDAILVFVAFRYRHHPQTNEQIHNNFVTTAWADISMR